MMLNTRGRLVEFKRPAVMGIVNVTPDSFYAGSRTATCDVTARVARMIAEGADIIDLGGYSSRPGADEVSADEELARVAPALEAIRREFPDIIVSVDTFRASVARESVALGADIINDISGGDLDPEMFDTVAALRVPYILMHMRGKPDTMQSMTDYDDVAAETLRDLAFKADRLHQLGVCDVIVDPGFGFAKTTDQNYALLGALKAFRAIGPLLVGISRKTMIWRELDTTPENALNGTTVLNTIALMNGADILRVHDVREAAETVRLFEAYRRNRPEQSRTISVTDRTGHTTTEMF